ncbi:MAG: hypothetical protein HQK75_15930 [Candidatus Magnetomorum sp.]|nr:hypothetical protein [Candidatus Magnetomorum sp.]
MTKKFYFFIIAMISVFFIFNTVDASEQGLFVDISQPSPIGDRTIPMNATTNPIALTVSDSDGGPLIVLCTSSQPAIVPNDDTHIIINGMGQRITVDAQKNEKKHLTARMIPIYGKSGRVCLTFKVIDPGGLFATKAMNLTVTTATVNNNSDTSTQQYAYVSPQTDVLLQKLLFSIEPQPLIKFSSIGEGSIRMDHQSLSLPFQTIVTKGEGIQVEALASQDFKFAYWSGDMIDTENPLNILAKTNLDIQAVFVSSDQQQTSEGQNWELGLWLSDDQNPDTILSEIHLGISDSERKDTITEPNPLIYILSDQDEHLLSSQSITQKGEQFRSFTLNPQLATTLHWQFEQNSSGFFELIDAQTNMVYVSDMQTVSEWRIPDTKEMKQLMLHYIPQ